MYIFVENCIDYGVYRIDSDKNLYGVFDSKDASFVILNKNKEIEKKYHKDVSYNGIAPIAFVQKIPKDICKSFDELENYLISNF